MIVLFDNDGKLIGYSNVKPPNIEKYIDLGDVDLLENFWDGDFYTGELKNISKYFIKNSEVEDLLFGKIKETYSNELMQFLIIKQLKLLAEKQNCFDPDFKNLCNFLEPLFKNEKYIK